MNTQFGFTIGQQAFFANFNGGIVEIIIAGFGEAIPNSDGEGYIIDQQGFKRSTMNLFRKKEDLEFQLNCDELIYDEFEGEYV